MGCSLGDTHISVLIFPSVWGEGGKLEPGMAFFPSSKHTLRFPHGRQEMAAKTHLRVLVMIAAVTTGTWGCSSVAPIPGSRNEPTSQRNASLRILTWLEGCGS